VTHFADLSPYGFLPDTVPEGVTAKCVGWLDGRYGYPTGAAPDGFLEALALLCRDDRRAGTRGWHGCDLAHPDGGEPGYPVRVRIGEELLALGDAEVRTVSAGGEWLIAPTLVHHYVRDHHYLPPAEFIESVLAGRTAPSR
jgi:hypothetical protein